MTSERSPTMTTRNDLLLVGDFCRSSWLEEDVKPKCPVASLHVAVSSTSFCKNQARCTAIARVSFNVIKSLQLQEGDAAILMHKSHEGIDEATEVVVRLEMMEEDEEEQFRPENSQENAVCVPPIVITNLGMSPKRLLGAVDKATEECENPSSLTCLHLPQEENETVSLIQAQKPQLAQHVVLQPLGRSPAIPLYKPAVSQESGRNGDNNSDGTDQAYIYPSLAGALLQHGMICSVPDPRHPGMVLYYRVVRIVSNVKEAKNDPNRHCIYAITHSQTTFELDSATLPQHVPRLPPLRLQSAFYQELWEEQRSRKGPQPGSVCSLPHPNLMEVADALLHHCPNNHSNSNMTDAAISSRIIHIIASDADHDVVACVEAAAHHMGYHCLHVRGLAAFGYNQGHTPRVGGGLLDQLHGLQASIEYIQTQRRMEPCVLHLQAIDQELNSLDEPLQQEQQDRFWMKLIDGLRNYESDSADCAQNDRSCPNYRFTPSLLIVLSSSSPLKQGPWMERLVFPSISLSTPDECYLKYLWNQYEDCASNCSGNSSIKAVLHEDGMALLLGRPAHEIRAIHQELKILTMIESSNEDMRNKKDAMTRGDKMLRMVCDNIDAGRRKATSNISKISPVHWEDVGGLEHVRTEIMDAIELPLKNPHLFPSRTGRSGILLFGPPGTGKTLVAKAVATECELPFLSVKGPELLGSYVGESEANVRQVFASARAAAADNLPIAASILFFDELDSLAPRRGGMDHGGGVMDRVVASLLAELDGPGSNDGNGNELDGQVFVLGATNRPDLLDPSLLRPGRLDRLVYLGIPADHEERSRVLASQLRKMKLDGDPVEMAGIVVRKLPPRLSGADMSKLSSGAMLNAVYRLCREAEEEQEQDGNGRSIDNILESWGDERCTPVITMEDLLQASQDISPSISEAEMLRYERLQAVHNTKIVK